MLNELSLQANCGAAQAFLKTGSVNILKTCEALQNCLPSNSTSCSSVYHV